MLDQHQQFHQVLIYRWAGRLNQEHIAAANVLVQLDADLSVGKIADIQLAEANAQVSGDFFRQIRIRSATEYRQMLVHTCSTAIGPDSWPDRNLVENYHLAFET